jgi:hypothetical protein
MLIGEEEPPHEETTDLPVARLVTSIGELAERGNQRRPDTLLLLCCLGILAVIGAVLGGVCGSGLCSSPNVLKDPAQPTTDPPPASPTNKYRPFTSTEELYQAVDA